MEIKSSSDEGQQSRRPGEAAVLSFAGAPHPRRSIGLRPPTAPVEQKALSRSRKKVDFSGNLWYGFQAKLRSTLGESNHELQTISSTNASIGPGERPFTSQPNWH